MIHWVLQQISILLDINECEVNNGNCTQVCTNTNGGYLCACTSGFVLSADAKTCTGKPTNSIVTIYFRHVLFSSDVNECATNNGNCVQVCTNTIGSYLCQCRVGYVLNADGRSCDGMHWK